MIIHTKRTDLQRVRKPPQSIVIPNLPNSTRIFHQAVYREIFKQRQNRVPKHFHMEEMPKPIKIKEGNKFSITTFEQAIYKKVTKLTNPLAETTAAINQREEKNKNKSILKTPLKKRKRDSKIDTKRKKRK